MKFQKMLILNACDIQKHIYINIYRHDIQNIVGL